MAELVGQSLVTSGIPEDAPLLGFLMPRWVSSSQTAAQAISSPAQKVFAIGRQTLAPLPSS